MPDQNAEVWLRMYEEQVQHARHHETLRSQSTNLIIAVSAALLVFSGGDDTTPLIRDAMGTFLVLVNVYGLIMSLKHYERSRLHVTVAAQYRDVLSAVTPISDQQLNQARAAGHGQHSNRFRGIRQMRAYVLWSGLHVILALLGVLVILS